ncbi:phosphate-repressible phosphate permease pho-4 [Coccomyxa sp. Obi]|nr:phosphate-repressible phosphate permease pho-4 [Coccomyxa sp. Obi]
MPQAIMVAAVCEFLGAILLGAGVTDTIRSNIAKISLYTNAQALLLYGMVCVQIAAAFWDNFACHLELPVSTTHTTVGAVIGMSLVLYGGTSVVWIKHIDTFIYISGFVPVVLSWVVSPVLSGIIVTILYGLIRTFVLRSKHSFTRAFYILPLLVALTFFVIVVFIIQTGAKNKQFANNNISDGTTVWIGIVIGFGLGLLTLLLVMPYLRKRALRWDNEQERNAAAAAAAQRAPTANETDPEMGRGKQETVIGIQDAKTGKETGVQQDQPEPVVLHKHPEPKMNALERGMESFASKISGFCTAAGNSKTVKTLTNNPVANVVLHGSRYKVHNTLDEQDTKNYNAEVVRIWNHGEEFDPKTEHLFRYLQVFSAMVMSFAHGSNDVANALGPFSAVYYIWSTGRVPSSVPVEEWILVVGGAGIVLGLATYGYKIMRVLGVKSVKLSNSRGFCAELSTAMTVVLASRFGLPVSTTQVLTGALLALGFFEGSKGINVKGFLRIFAGWVITIIVAGLVAAGFTAWGVFTPNRWAPQSFT